MDECLSPVPLGRLLTLSSRKTPQPDTSIGVRSTSWLLKRSDMSFPSQWTTSETRELLFWVRYFSTDTVTKTLSRFSNHKGSLCVTHLIICYNIFSCYRFLCQNHRTYLCQFSTYLPLGRCSFLKSLFAARMYFLFVSSSCQTVRWQRNDHLTPYQLTPFNLVALTLSGIGENSRSSWIRIRLRVFECAMAKGFYILDEKTSSWADCNWVTLSLCFFRFVHSLYRLPSFSAMRYASECELWPIFPLIFCQHCSAVL